MTGVFRSERPAGDERRAAAEQALQAELRRIVDSGQYGAWFAKLTCFHHYSPTNSLWILAQRPDATRVASYRTWQQLDRQVRRGERGIMVFHPRPFWVDPATGERVAPPRSDAERARLDRRVSFGVGYVFDVAQTDGQPLPLLDRPPPETAPRALADHLERSCHDQGVTVEIRSLPGGLAGYYQRSADRIVLAADGSLGERVATLAHELAHRADPELIAAHQAGDRSYYVHHRADCEAVAEAAAHALSARFGHDITVHSAGYIAGWIAGDVDRLHRLHERVGQVTRLLVPPDPLDVLLEAARQQTLSRPADRVAGRPR